MLEIDFINNAKLSVTPYKKLAYQLLANGLEILKLRDKITLTIEFVEDERALELNKKYRQKNYIPDVLSFPTNISSQEIEALGFRELGDIIISIPEAQRKAKKYNHSLNLEIAFLLVHGFLHLLGFDHEKNLQQERVMFKYQEKILNTANFNYILLTD